ncbi:MAG TPA: translocation/assembly module TamB domain-containing protein [Thermoanaerobaculia bacterium]|nr:translocation/assembly module TamB domain-containing protein [Thermoanaerobaculia bacterium]
MRLPGTGRRSRGDGPQRVGTRRRRGRRVLRVLAWAAAVFAVLLTVLYFVAQSGWTRERVRVLVEARMSEYLERDVEVGRVEYGLRPGNFVLYDLVIPSPDPDDPPFARVPRTEVQFALHGWTSLTIDITLVEVERPEVHALFFDDGSNNFPELTSRGDGRGRVEVKVGRVRVLDGVVAFEHRRFPLSLDASNVRALVTAAGETPDGGDRFEAIVVAQDLRAVLPDARPWAGSAAAKGVFAPGRIDFTAGRLSGPDLLARFEGFYAWSEADRRGRFDLVARGDAELANRLGYLEAPLSGPFEFLGELVVDSETLRYHGSVTSERLRFERRVFTEVLAEVAGGDEAVRVDVERAGYAGGRLADVLVRVELADAAGEEGGGRPVRVEGGFADLSVATLVADQEIESELLADVTGRATGTFQYRFRSDDPLAGSGSVDLRLAGVRGLYVELPLDARAELAIRRGALSSDDILVTAPGQRITAAGTYDLQATTGSFEFDLRSRDLARLAAALPLETRGEPPWLPTAGAGTATGQVDFGPETVALRAQVDLAGVRTATLQADRITGGVAWEDGTLTLSDLVLEGPGQRLLATGRYDFDAATGRFEYRLNSQDLGELAGLIPFEGGPPAWLPTAGAGTVEGELEILGGGRFRGPTSFDLTGVVVSGERFDTLAGSLRLEPGAVRDLRVEATADGGALMAAGSIPLPLDTAGPGVDLTLDAVDFPLERITAFLPNAPEVTGRFTGTAQVAGGLDDLRGAADLETGPLTIAGIELTGAVGRVEARGPELVVQRLEVMTPAGVTRLTGTWNRTTGELDLVLVAPDIDLGEPPLSELVPGELAGTAELLAEITGTVELPRVEAQLQARGLTLGGRTLGGDGEAVLTAVWDGRLLETAGSLLGLVDFTGGGPLTTERAALRLALDSDQLAALVAAATGREVEGLTGGFAGVVEVAGPFAPPEALTVELRLSELVASYEGQTIRNLEPVVLAYRPGALVVESLYLGEPRTASELFATGTVGLAEGTPLDLRLQADVDAAWLELAVPGVEVDGRVLALAVLGGTASDPRLNGQGEITGGELIVAGFPHAFENLQATLLFYPDRVVLDSLAAEVAGGEVRGAGRLELASFGDGPLDFRLQAEAENVSVRYPEGFLLRGDAVLTLADAGQGRLLSGVVELERAFYLQDVPAGLNDLLGEMFQRSRLEAGETDPGLASTQLNVAIEGEDALRVRNNVADLTGDVELTLRGSLARPVLFGQVEVDRGGEVVYVGNEYEVVRGLLTFANPYRIDPVIDLVAETEVRNYDIALNLSGTLDRLNAEFTSDPPLAELDVLALLTIGNTVGESGQLFAGGTTGTGGASAQQFLYGQAASVLAERVNTLFGFDRLRVAGPAAGTVGGASALEVTVGKQISRDLYLTYIRNPASQGQDRGDLFQVEWQAEDNVLVVFTQNGDGSYRVDVLAERRF